LEAQRQAQRQQLEDDKVRPPTDGTGCRRLQPVPVLWWLRVKLLIPPSLYPLS